jgi:aquaporin Z
MRKLLAEFFGTYWLVFGGCGSALFAAGIPDLGIGFIGVSLAFGLTVLTMAYAVGHISGGHFNPAVSFGLWAGGRFSAKELAPYIIAQCVGAIAAAGTLYMIASGKPGFAIDNTKAGAFASNGFGAFSPDGYSMQSAFIAEFVLTLFFLLIILGATDKFANGKFAGIAIGLGLTLIHLISIPITNTSVNPARSLSQALFVGGEPLTQVWLFWAAPILGAIAAGFIYKNLLQDHKEQAA